VLLVYLRCKEAKSSSHLLANCVTTSLNAEIDVLQLMIWHHADAKLRRKGAKILLYDRV
jgi:hypothetical protein